MNEKGRIISPLVGSERLNKGNIKKEVDFYEHRVALLRIVTRALNVKAEDVDLMPVAPFITKRSPQRIVRGKVRPASITVLVDNDYYENLFGKKSDRDLLVFMRVKRKDADVFSSAIQTPQEAKFV